MTKREAMRLTQQENALMSLGFTRDEADKLRRISNTLRRWHELECGDDNGCVEREHDDGTGRAYWRNAHTDRRYPIADRETGALKRLTAILKARNDREPEAGAYLDTYVQGDPRGAALYILRPGDVPEGGDASAYYSRGICVY